jgi:hypothetical protein
LTGEPSVTLALGGLTVPLPQLTDTVTLAALLSEKSLLTWNSATASLTIVQVPALSVAWQVPVLVYPLSPPLSVAVQDVLPAVPVTANVAGVASDAESLDGATVPAPQKRETITVALKSSEKSLWTMNVPVAVLVIVQLAAPPLLMATLAQLSDSV